MESCRGYNAPPRVLSACLSQVLPIWPPACRRWELFRSVKGAPAHSERSPNRKLPFPLVQRLFGLRRVRSRPRGLCAPQGSLDRARRGPYAPTKREWERCRASGCPALTTASPWVRPSVAATGGYRVSFTHKLCYRPVFTASGRQSAAGSCGRNCCRTARTQSVPGRTAKFPDLLFDTKAETPRP